MDVNDPPPATAGRPPSARPLTRDRALALLREHPPELECRFGVRPVALFGSVARNEARPDSDVGVGSYSELKPRAASYVARELVRVA